MPEKTTKIIIVKQTMVEGETIEPTDGNPVDCPSHIARELITAQKAILAPAPPVQNREDIIKEILQTRDPETVEDAVVILNEFGDDKGMIEAFVLKKYGIDLDKRKSPEGMIEDFQEVMAGK